ncbi:unnamed protein product (macronuclear) [Paramecium tetraurelia]|uniref:Uncharacterized protein n=1 Tax=Paramecium tetraurelia TaxID=5888 RepID=A0DZE9_PARTE|nr:uncharacterized protein GSPATT00021583001 [Paramecium tetraurelia]CAK88416.1 unnamed protein product [Paramecium tetraurelia]|eukprot:XP_001455813.1 hypothetical protein (macronuclear) [Paramecium tetraurelia strain d4-2]
MAEDQQPFSFTPEGGSATNSTKDYSGKGIATYPNGDTYEGQYVNGIREGKGKYTYNPSGDKYEGEFLQNLKHGIGRLIYANNKGEYYGQWEQGLRHGEGLYTYANKDVYSGQWSRGKKHGQGTYVFNDTAMRFRGTWNNNEIVDGEWIYPNGTVYRGPFQHNKPNGVGRFEFANKNQVEGYYTQTIVPNANPDDTTLNIQLEWVTTKHY